MLFKEIEAIFTQKVTNLIQKGYTFNCNTMSGHQGEIANVDLKQSSSTAGAAITRRCGRA